MNTVAFCLLFKTNGKILIFYEIFEQKELLKYFEMNFQTMNVRNF